MRIEVGPFFLEEPIGRGGMGEVWRGHHATQGLAVAIKVLTQEGARKPLYVKSFHNEVAAICRLHHDGIIRVFDYGVISELASERSQGRLVTGSPYLVMELAQLGSLENYSDALRWPELRAIVLTTLEALAHAHARGIIHRDLKPQNILIGCGKSQHIKLSDFGLAHAMQRDKPAGEDDEALDAGWGTPAYMAPEQFRGYWRDYGAWTDLYALGCMAFELCTGSVPFVGEDRWEFGRMHLLEDVPRLEPRFDVPEGFEAWLVRLLQKLPSDRFQRAADASLALISLGDPLDTARPEGHIVPVALSYSVGSLFPNEKKAVAYMTQEVPRQELALKLQADRRPRSIAQTSDGFHHDVPEPMLTLQPVSVNTVSKRTTPNAPMKQVPFDSEGFERGVMPDSKPRDTIAPFPINLPPMPLSWRGSHMPTVSGQLHGAGIGLYGLLEPELIGREVERDLLWQCLRDVHASGQPRAVLLRGASGVGKSMIAQWLLARAHELGVADVMRAIHSPRRTSFDGLSAMLARYLRVQGCEPEERRERLRTHLDARWCMEYGLGDALDAFIVPPVEETRNSVNVLSGHPSRQRLHTLRAFLEYETRDRPLIVLLEDVQWAPEALVMVQNVLTCRMALSQALPVLFVMTLRDDVLDSSVLEALLVQQVTALGACMERTVEPLCDEEARTLIETLLNTNPGLTSALVSRSHGNPLFAVQLLGELVHAHKLTLSDDGFELVEGERLELPDDIHELWQQRVDRCVMRYPDAHPTALELASALGQDFSFAEWFELSRLLGYPIDLDFVEGLEADGLLSFEQDCVSFSHNLLRESLERASRDQGRWAQLNEAIVDYLSVTHTLRSSNVLTRIAEHLILADRHVEALEPLLEAARQTLANGQVQRAEHLLELHAQILGTLPDVDHARELEQDTFRAVLLNLQGHSQKARDMGLGVMQRAHLAQLDEAWNVASLIVASTSLQLGDTTQAAELFQIVRQRFEAESPQRKRYIVWCKVGMARLGQIRGDYRGAEELFKQALLSMPELDFPGALMSTCFNGLGDVYRKLGEFDKAKEFTLESLASARKHDNPMLIADCYNDLSELARQSGDLHEARKFVNRAIELYESMGSDQSLRAHRNMGYLALAEHDLSQAQGIFETLHEHLRHSNELAQLTFVLAGLLPCLVSAQRVSEFEDVLAQLESSLQKTQQLDDAFQFAFELTCAVLDDAALAMTPMPSGKGLWLHDKWRGRVMALAQRHQVKT